MKKFLSILILSCLFLNSACSYKEEFEKSESSLGTRNKEEKKQIGRAYGFQVAEVDHHQFKRMNFDLETATEISRMDGISASFVILTDRNAYVAIVTDDSATGTNARGNARQFTNNIGTTEGVYDVNRKSSYADPRKLVTDSNSLYTIADPKDISSKLKQRVAEIVRQQHPYVIEVFISANRDFINTLNVYYQDMWRGKSLDPYVEEFKSIVKVHFVE